MGRLSTGFRTAGRLTVGAAGLGVVIGLALLLAPAAAAADWAEFGKPTAGSTYAGGVDFRQPVTIDRPLARVELLLTLANAIGPTVIPIEVPSGTGPTTLTYHFDPEADGRIVPNTRLVARWRLVSDGDRTDISVGPQVELIFADDRFAWRSVAGDLVRVHWYEGPAAFGQRALRIGEGAVREAAELLGVTESDPIDFFLYADRDAFYDVLGPRSRENVGGVQIPGLRTMFALVPPDQIDDAWVGIVVPHELTHLVFDTAAGNPYHFPPRWLNEGLAVYVSQGYDSSDRALVEQAAGGGAMIPLDGLTGEFPTSYERFSLAYAESVSAVDYLVRAYGEKPLVTVIRSYAGGRTDDEAFGAALGLDMTAFGAAWLNDLGAAAPIRYGPQPAPAGPIPSAWLAGAETSATAAASDDRAASDIAPSQGPLSAPGSPSPGVEGGEPLAVVAVLLVGAGAVALIVVIVARRRRIDSADAA